MEQMILNMLEQLPNMAVAIVVLWWQQKTINRLGDSQIELIEKYTNMVDQRNGIKPRAPVREMLDRE
jgi:hypothetical protein